MTVNVVSYREGLERFKTHNDEIHHEKGHFQWQFSIRKIFSLGLCCRKHINNTYSEGHTYVSQCFQYLTWENLLRAPEAANEETLSQGSIVLAELEINMTPTVAHQAPPPSLFCSLIPIRCGAGSCKAAILVCGCMQLYAAHDELI